MAEPPAWMLEAATQVRQVVEEVAKRSTVPVFAGNEDDGKLVGSGVLVKIADERFLVTAGHVAWDGWQPTSTIALGTRGGNVNLQHAKIWHTNPADDRHEEDPLDIAVVRLTEDHETRLRAAGHEFRRQDTIVSRYSGKPPMGDLVFLAGFPQHLEVKNVEERTLDVTHLVLPSTLTNRTDFAKFDPASHMVALYPSRLVAEGFALEGVSGGGVWAALTDSRGHCTPDEVRLIGIQVSWKKALLLAKSTRMRIPLAIIRRYLPELKPALDLALVHGDHYPHLSLEQDDVPKFPTR